MKRCGAIVLLLVTALTGCTPTAAPIAEASTPSASPSPAPPTPTPTSTPIAEAPPVISQPVAEEVTFTYECGYFEADGETYTSIPTELRSLEESWAHEPATAFCKPIQHGTVYTAIQHEAVALAGDVLRLGIEQVDALYAQCAIRDSSYLDNDTLAPNHAQEVRAFLHLCPDRPGADVLRALLGE